MEQIRYASRMSDSDALMWHIEKDPMLRSTITALVLFDKTPDRDKLLERMEVGTRLVPRLRQRVKSNPYSIAPPRWEIDPNFDLHYHVRFTKAPGDGTFRDVLDVCEPLAMQGFDRARPLWEMVVIEGLEDGAAAVVLKIHHAITDGVGAIKIGMVLFDLEPDAETPEMPALPTVHVMNQVERTLDAITFLGRRNLGRAKRFLPQVASGLSGSASDPVGTAQRSGETLASIARMTAPANDPLSPIMQGRSLSVHFDTLSFPLEEMKAAARAAGGRLNDAFVAGVAGGLRRYHERHDAPVDGLRMSMPINIRNDSTSDEAGNQFAPARFVIPITVEDPAEAMTVMRELVAEQRAEPALELVAPLSGVLNRLPTTVLTGVFGAMLKGVDFITSNVPGIPIPVYLAGAKVTAQWAFGPMSGSATNITLVSYIDDIHIAINVDPAAVPDPDVFVECMRESFDEIRKLA